jgi:hypothetical protein
MVNIYMWGKNSGLELELCHQNDRGQDLDRLAGDLPSE